MRLRELVQCYQNGKIEKKVMWSLLRERLLPLLEYQELVADSNCAIEVRSDGVVFTASPASSGGGEAVL